MKGLILSLGILTLIVAACVETEPVSPIPEIGFESYELGPGYDSLLGNYLILGLLEFSFIDGDANFGIDTYFDTSAPDWYNYNIFLSAYEKIDSNYFPIEFDSTNPPLNYRVTRDYALDRVGQNKTVKGYIRINMGYYLIPDYDTIRYDFYITDRAYNKSNVVSTSDIGFKGVSLPEPEPEF